MNKVLVVGPSGAGKSSMSCKLRDILNLPLYHLDNIFWKDGQNSALEMYENEKLRKA